MHDSSFSFGVAGNTLIYAGLAMAIFLSLGGCAGKQTAAQNASGVFTASDEPESRKRASNHLQLAVVYFTDGKTNISLDETKQAIAADPNWFEGYNMRGLIYWRMKEFGLADTSFQKALGLNPQSAEVKHNYGVLLCDQGRVAEAVRMFGAAAASPEYGERSNTLISQGTCQMKNGQPAEAEASFQRSLEINPSNPLASYNLGLLLFQRGEFARSQQFVRRLNNSESASAESLWLGVKVERRLDNREAMAQLGTQLRKRFPQSREASALERGAYDE
jgi:type IV pilus assembly protein PilF